MFGRKHRAQHTDGSNPVLRCSFCNKDENNVRKLIAGPTVFICGECVEVCTAIIADDAASKATDANEGQVGVTWPDVAGTATSVQCALCHMTILVSDGLKILNRGILCRGCLGEVEAAIAEMRESGQ
jgi:hypothetical protein